MAEEILLELEERMEKNLESLKKEISQVSTGRANPNVLTNLQVEYYGAKTPLTQVANISNPEAQQLLIKPFDKSLIPEISRVINASNLGLNPSNNGDTIRLVFPQLTEQRRKDLSKQVKAMGEKSKVGLRNIRRDGNDSLKKIDLTEDSLKGYNQDVQTLTDTFISQVDEIIKSKEKDLMKI